MNLKSYITKIVNAFNIRNLVIFAMPISMAILIIMLYNFSQTVEHLSHALIKRTITKTNMELHDFFEPVVNTMIITRDEGLGGNYNKIDAAVLNPKFIPFLKNSRQVSSMLIATSNGEEYMLLQEDSTWQNRCTLMEKGKRNVVRHRWKYSSTLDGKIIETWKNTNDSANSPLQKGWYLGAMENTDSTTPAWTSPYTFKTTQDPGITASINWKSKNQSTNLVLAFDVLLTDISKFTTSLEISTHGKALVFTDDDEVVGLPADNRFLPQDSLKKYVLKTYSNIQMPLVEFALNDWKTKSYIVDKPFGFKYDGGLWWCGVEKFKLNNEKSFYIAVIVPEADFLAEVNRTRIVIIAGFLLVTVLTLLVIKGYNQKRKDNLLLRQQKLEIEAQRDKIETQKNEIEVQRDVVTHQKNQIEKIHSELKSSINYAQRIQQAVLPDAEFLDSILSDYFVFYRPHSVVSGDFYWATKVNTKLIFTAADCTGHGVPGAFMSMLGVSFLNDIVKKSEVTTAGQVLDLLRDNIINALKQHTEPNATPGVSNVKDGMDISFSVFDQVNYQLQFAGANNPLYIVRNKLITPSLLSENLEPDLSYGDFDLYEVKADKMPIAIYEKMEHFTTHKLQLAKGDRLYMFSDGFLDQFGGPEGKKYKSRPFKKLILELSVYPMKQQRNLLEQALENWIAAIDENGESYSQTDDVVVVGILV